VPGDGNCTFSGLIEVAGPQIQRLLRTRDTPTVSDLRKHLVKVLEEDRRREEAGLPTRYGGFVAKEGRASQTRGEVWDEHLACLRAEGGWNHESGELVVQILSYEFGLPMTVIKDTWISDVGPRGESRYVLVLGDNHYSATRPTRPGHAPEPTDVPPAETTAQIKALHDRLTWLRGRLDHLRPGIRKSKDQGITDALKRLHAIERRFEQILNYQQPEDSVQPASSWHQQRLNNLEGEYLAWIAAARGLEPRIAPPEDSARWILEELQDWSEAAAARQSGGKRRVRFAGV
jgi:hypothetical protein